MKMNAAPLARRMDDGGVFVMVNPCLLLADDGQLPGEPLLLAKALPSAT